ncbi:uncharacterized protein LOC105213048 [Zeugodacus cucurbitae]|uniref:uncharacterized protein LOC105213048 n=1 Tax=Zeugodacus cucurbitae TaxID=28588 RepID=UPI00059682B7|nr:uncharacterized protein LOC105213048 [Zeugodacus cucurbitae]
MELRSGKKSDYKTSLMNLGLYEDGMKLEEMKQVMQALEESELECETVFFENDLERALKESELDFVHMQCDVHSSTLNKTDDNCNFNIVRPLPQGRNNMVQYIPNSDASPFDSPEIASEKIVVRAIVHHELNYSPPQLKWKFEKDLQHDFQTPIKTCQQSGNTLKRKVAENVKSNVHSIKRSGVLITSSPKIHRTSLEIHSQCDSEDLDQVTDDSHSDPSF